MRELEVMNIRCYEVFADVWSRREGVVAKVLLEDVLAKALA